MPVMPLSDAASEVVVATAEVARRDPVMANFMAGAGPVQMRPGVGDYFGALVRSIMYQQLAGKAAAAIHGRFVDALGGEVTPATLLAADPEQLRGAGLSGAKLAAVTDLAIKVTDGTVPLDHIHELPDDDITARLSSVRGIGRWTAEMFMLFELRRLDVWPTGDLAVRNGYGLIHGLEPAPTAKELEPLGDAFRPYRSVVAWYCWQAVHIARGDLLLPGGDSRRPATSPQPVGRGRRAG